jgi:UDP-glucose 4-epimerase
VETSVKQLAELLARAAGRRSEVQYAPARAGELQRSVLANDKAARELGWRPRVTLADGLQATVQLLAQQD